MPASPTPPEAPPEPTPAEPEALPGNVIAALARVMHELPGIGKDSKAAEQQGGYAYRGIEAITAGAQRLLGRYGVVFVPEVLDVDTRDLVVNGKPWTDTVLRVRYRVFGPGGLEDHVDVGPLVAIGRDNSDKGANKAMTQAFKYALLQVLCIGDPKDDADSGSPATDRAGKGDERSADDKARDNGWNDEADRLAAMNLAARVAQAAGKDTAARVKTWLAAHELHATQMPGWVASMEAFRWLAGHPEASAVELDPASVDLTVDREGLGAVVLRAFAPPDVPEPDPEPRGPLSCPSGHQFVGPLSNSGKQCPRCKEGGVKATLSPVEAPAGTDAPEEAPTGVSAPEGGEAPPVEPDAEPGAEDADADGPAAEACELCGSRRAKTVVVKGVRRCQHAHDCERRQAANAEAPAPEAGE